MTSVDSPPRLPIREAKDWVKILSGYRQPDNRRSLIELGITFLPFVGFCWGSYLALSVNYGLALLACIPAAGFLARLFVIQHDCGHGAFFESREWNVWVGRALSVLTLTPFDDWKHSHAEHHAISGCLDKRRACDIKVMTVREYQTAARPRQIQYRILRHPILLFIIAPVFVFFFRYRLPHDFGTADKRLWAGVMLTNLAILLAAAAVVSAIGLSSFLMLYIPIISVAGAIGIWMFYIQHQFEDTVWANEADWQLHSAALHGSSFYDLPAALTWMTGNIGIHHVHHLNSRIPFYRLTQVLADHPELTEIARLDFWDSLACINLNLWDEDQKRLVSFKAIT